MMIVVDTMSHVLGFDVVVYIGFDIGFVVVVVVQLVLLEEQGYVDLRLRFQQRLAFAFQPHCYGKNKEIRNQLSAIYCMFYFMTYAQNSGVCVTGCGKWSP